ncbi:class B sortase [Pseudoflavonifractor capillosus]|uniref:class B sortase n=1 Tax=Pseudoflavonifractor capillosus TaxID=106588 RepID=UPI001FB03D69|nr:class B sortase [Pseudoflavonifractor capillosus]
MYTPEEPEYYLRRAFDGTDSQSGVPFLDASCTEDGSNYLIYGHNMKNGSMFAALLSYADADFAKEHPIIRFDTLTESGIYEVLAAFYTEIYPKDAEGVFRYYQYTTLDTPERFAEYLSNVKAAALYNTGVEAEYGDQLLTLTTCSYHTGNGRFVVVARKETA